MNEFVCIAPDVKLGKDVKLSKFINMYGCEVGDETKIGAFVEIQKNARIGRRCKISSHTFVCEGVHIEDNVFIGHSVTFINDSYPRSTTPGGRTANRGRLESRNHHGAQGRIHWLRLDHLEQRHRRPQRHRRRGQRGDQRRARQRHRRRKPSKVSAVYLTGEKVAMTSTTKVPFLDLVTPHQELEAELLAVAKKVFSTAGFIGGPMVEDFERDFAAFCDAKYCVGVNSGTDALRFAFMAAGVEQGDIIVTVPHTFIATTEAISQAGAQIAFVDIDEATYTMDPEKLREYFETRCDFDSKTKNSPTAKPESASPPSFPCISTGKPRTWIPSWRWPPSTM